MFKETKQIPLIFLANKMDLTEDGVPLELSGKLDAIISKYGAQFFPTSAKTGKNVEVAFSEIGKTLTKKFF